MPLDKQRVYDALLQLLRADLDTQLTAVRMAIDEATGEQSKAENQYDTRSLEASYLARGQSERVGALRGAVDFLERQASARMQRAGLGALVHLEASAGNLWVLLVPSEGGRRIIIDGVSISVLTPDSPLGLALLGCTEGDEIEIDAERTLQYQILSIS